VGSRSQSALPVSGVHCRVRRRLQSEHQHASVHVIDCVLTCQRLHTTPAVRRLTSRTTSAHRDASAPAAWWELLQCA
jgi:hypothetical protein